MYVRDVIPELLVRMKSLIQSVVGPLFMTLRKQKM